MWGSMACCAAVGNRRCHSVVQVSAGKANSSVPDSEVLEFAVAENRILLSHNRIHFLRLHRHRTEAHSGIVLCAFDLDFRALAERIHAAVAATPDMSKQLMRVNGPA